MMVVVVMVVMARVQNAANDVAHVMMVVVLRQPRFTGCRRRVALSFVGL
jgi:hypothetical protein